MKKKPLVDDWTIMNKGGVYKIDKNRNVIVRFDKILNVPKNNTVNEFLILRTSYKNRLDKVVGYSNYFFKYYDPKKEVINKIGLIKGIIDVKCKKVKKKYFMTLVSDIVLTTSFIRSIENMVDDNYLYILGKNSIVNEYHDHIISDKYGKRIMCAVVAINILYPLIIHFVTTCNKKDDDLYEYFLPIIDIFSDEVIDIYEKIAMFVWSIIQISAKKNRKLWRQRAELGDMGKDEFYDICLRKHIITDSLPSLIFDNNMASYFQKVLEQQIGFYLRSEYEYMPILLNDERDENSLSSIDKFEMTLSKLDESIVILAENNLKNVISTLKERFNLYISKSEYDYYVSNLNLDKIQIRLINYYYAKYFNGYRDLKLIGPFEYIELVLMLKRRLQAQGSIYLPYILTGNFKNRAKTNKILTNKLIKEIQNSVEYQDMIANKLEYIIQLKGKDPVLGLLQSILSSTYMYVDYDNKERTGKKIEYDIDVFIVEFLSFINQI